LRGIALALWLLAAAPTLRAEIVRLELDEDINPISAEFVTRCIAAAEGRNANLLLFRLNAPGGFSSVHGENNLRNVKQPGSHCCLCRAKRFQNWLAPKKADER
jgi:hypothetical protein